MDFIKKLAKFHYWYNIFIVETLFCWEIKFKGEEFLPLILPGLIVYMFTQRWKKVKHFYLQFTFRWKSKLKFRICNWNKSV